MYIIDITYILIYYGGVKEMNDMLTISATEARNNWSQVAESAIREKPQFIKRTRDYLFLSDKNFIAELLSSFSFNAESFVEDDGSVTLSLNEIDLVENAPTEEEAISQLASSILDYAEEFYSNFTYWSSAPNRKSHIPFVVKALVLSDVKKIGACVNCQAGKI